jgi:hypothetical protein
MLTQYLEKLIWEGKATFKTFVAGGSQRHLLNINNDRFIIITDITYFNSGHFPEDPTGATNQWTEVYNKGMNTQITIGGERGVNRFLFRNNFVAVPNTTSSLREHLSPIGSTTINTYLIHTTQIAFSFSYAQDFIGQTVLATEAENYALNTPTDYGRDGQPGVIPVTVSGTVNGAAAYVDNFGNRPGAPGVNESKEFSFPVDTVNDIPGANRINSWAYPILHVNYVEIKGSPTNLGFN